MEIKLLTVTYEESLIRWILWEQIVICILTSDQGCIVYERLGVKTSRNWKWQTARFLFSKNKNSSSNFKKGSLLVIVQWESWQGTARGREVRVLWCSEGDCGEHRGQCCTALVSFNSRHRLTRPGRIWMHFIIQEIRMAMNGVLWKWYNPVFSLFCCSQRWMTDCMA